MDLLEKLKTKEVKKNPPFEPFTTNVYRAPIVINYGSTLLQTIYRKSIFIKFLFVFVTAMAIFSTGFVLNRYLYSMEETKKPTENEPIDDILHIIPPEGVTNLDDMNLRTSNFINHIDCYKTCGLSHLNILDVKLRRVSLIKCFSKCFVINGMYFG